MAQTDIGTCKISAKSDNLVTSWATLEAIAQHYVEGGAVH